MQVSGKTRKAKGEGRGKFLRKFGTLAIQTTM
jgi:hypothetical protein